jgi:NAD(P)-dependent dehydrogenase (short-subunit alcohol dehydrogenase family)
LEEVREPRYPTNAFLESKTPEQRGYSQRITRIATAPPLPPAGYPGFSDLSESVIQQTPLKRLGHATDIAETVRVLATTASYTTGAVITVDGGRVLA